MQVPEPNLHYDLRSGEQAKLFQINYLPHLKGEVCLDIGFLLEYGQPSLFDVLGALKVPTRFEVASRAPANNSAPHFT